MSKENSFKKGLNVSTSEMNQNVDHVPTTSEMNQNVDHVSTTSEKNHNTYYDFEILRYASKKLETDVYEIFEIIRKTKKQMNIGETGKTTPSESYFYSLSFEILHMNETEIKTNFPKICEKYEVNFNEVTKIIQELKSLLEKQDTNEIEKYIQKLDNNALKFFERKNKEKLKAR